MTATETFEARDGEVVVECDLDAAPEKVWRALTVPELVEQWLNIQSPGTERDGAAAEPSYEIVEAEPFSRLRYAWRDPETSVPDTIVTFELTPLPDGRTAFRLTHGIASGGRATVMAANSNSPPLALAA